MASEKIDTGELAAEIRDAGNVLWQGEPDPGSFFAGRTRAMRLRFAGIVVAGVVAAALAALPAAKFCREWGTAPASGGHKELAIMELIGNEGYFACFALGLMATAAVDRRPAKVGTAPPNLAQTPSIKNRTVRVSAGKVR